MKVSPGALELDVELAPVATDQLCGRNLEVPRSGAVVNEGQITIVGWVLGRECPAEAIEVICDGRVLVTVPVSLPRPDLSDAFPDVGWAGNGGFRTTVDLVHAAETTLQLRTVLADHRRAPLATLRLAGPATRTLEAVVLRYHSVADIDWDPWSLAVPPARFAEHLDVIASRCRPVALPELVAALSEDTIDERLVAVTFDDGYADNLEQALPLLEARGIPASFFVVADAAETEFWWDELEGLLLRPGRLPPEVELDTGGTVLRWRLDEWSTYTRHDAREHRSWRAWAPPPTARHELYVDLYRLLFGRREVERRAILDALRERVILDPHGSVCHQRLGADGIKALGASPLVEIGAHTLTHPKLTALRLAEQLEEILGSRSRLEELTGEAPRGFAYPNGAQSDYDDETITLVAEAGFDYACAAHGRGVPADANRFALPRVAVRAWTPDELAVRLESWLRG